MKKYLKHVITNPLFSGSAVMVLGTNLMNVLNYIYHLVMGRMLGPISYGELAALISVIGILGILPASFGLVIVKYISASSDLNETRQIINWFKVKIILFGGLAALLVIMISPWLSSFLKLSSPIHIIIISVYFYLSVLVLFYRSALQGLVRFTQLVASYLIETSMKLILGIALVFLGLSVGGALLALIVGVVLTLIFTYQALKDFNLVSGRWSLSYKQLFSYALPVAAQSLALTSFYSIDVILVKHFLPPFDAGLYAALSTLGKIILFAAGPIGMVMFPIVSQRQSKGLTYLNILLLGFGLTLIASLGILFLYWLFPKSAVNLLYGTHYLQAANYLVWFGLFIVSLTLSNFLVYFYLSLGKVRVVILPVIASVLQVIGIWLFHTNIFTVISISIAASSLLLLTLLFYTVYFLTKVVDNVKITSVKVR